MGGSTDSAILRAINGSSEAWAPAMRFFSEATNEGWVKILLGLLVLGMILRGAKTRAAALQALLAFPLANGITDLFKLHLAHPRPFQVEEVVLRSGWSDSMGTASAHSANMAAIAFVFTYRLGWWGAPWVLVAFLTGLSRIYNGVHYPTQVLLGWTCGVFAAFVVVKTLDAFRSQREARERGRREGVGPQTST